MALHTNACVIAEAHLNFFIDFDQKRCVRKTNLNAWPSQVRHALRTAQSFQNRTRRDTTAIKGNIYVDTSAMLRWEGAGGVGGGSWPIYSTRIQLKSSLETAMVVRTRFLPIYDTYSHCLTPCVGNTCAPQMCWVVWYTYGPFVSRNHHLPPMVA